MKKSGRDDASICRITIDERLDEGLIKIAIADILPGRENLSGDPLDAWSDERVELISRGDFLDTFKLDKDDPLLETFAGKPSPEAGKENSEGVFWRSLEEGQVFLVGEIVVEGADSKAPETIFARPGASTVLRIDRIEKIKQKHEDLYSKALMDWS